MKTLIQNLPCYLYAIGAILISLSMMSIALPIFGVLTMSSAIDAMMIMGGAGIAFFGFSILSENFVK